MHHRVASTDVRVLRLREGDAVEATAPHAGELAVLVQLSGRTDLPQDTRPVVVGRGDIVSLSRTALGRARLGVDSDALALLLPARTVPGLDDAVASARGGVLRAPDSALLPIVLPFAKHFAEHVADLGDLTAPAPQQLVRGAARMLAAALFADPPEAVDALTAARAYIDTNLGCTRLNPAMVAAATFVSVRTLHALFAPTGASVSARIRNRRLDACRLDLADDGCAHRTIADIALAHGLADPAHFSRLFAGRFGVSPRAYRAGRRREG
ncbi:helix-turn-helix domain-containing protein [Leifsonia sp. Le1]|uniref:helix-turn-helix domain-containing protein n=1 Tax=Leifsonia sp. Le1 TaxID=3404918 RepID=UPI003EBE8B69